MRSRLEGYGRAIRCPNWKRAAVSISELAKPTVQSIFHSASAKGCRDGRTCVSVLNPGRRLKKTPRNGFVALQAPWGIVPYAIFSATGFLPGRIRVAARQYPLSSPWGRAFIASDDDNDIKISCVWPTLPANAVARAKEKALYDWAGRGRIAPVAGLQFGRGVG